jgi:hypothetical protein
MVRAKATGNGQTFEPWRNLQNQSSSINANSGFASADVNFPNQPYIFGFTI